jgi:hypothetical protein
MTGRERNEMRKPLERERVAVVDVFRDRLP